MQEADKSYLNTGNKYFDHFKDGTKLNERTYFLLVIEQSDWSQYIKLICLTNAILIC